MLKLARSKTLCPNHLEIKVFLNDDNNFHNNLKIPSNKYLFNLKYPKLRA